MFDYDTYVKLTPKQKLNYLHENIRNSEKFDTLLMYCYDKRYTFGVRYTKKEINKILSKAKNEKFCDYDRILKALNNLLKIPQGKRKYAIEINANKFTKSELFLLLSILNKNIGVGYKQISKISNKIIYYPFMLAEKFNYEKIKLKKQISDFSNNLELFIQPKLDGVRMFYIPKENIFVTRNQDIITINERPNLVFVVNTFEKIRKLWNKYGMNKYVETIDELIFDGELYAGDWNTTMTIIQNKTKIDEKIAKKLNFYIFDVLFYEDILSYNKEFNEVVTEEPLRYRNEIIEELSNTILSNLKTRNVYIVNSIKLHIDIPEEKIVKIRDTIIEKGFEGIMVKYSDEFYYDKRTHAWQKFKNINEIDCEIIDIIEGDGKHQNKLGSLVVKSIINGKEITFQVGSGFSDELRKEIWKNKDKYIGKIVEIKYQELTKDNIPRFPTFYRFRDDKTTLTT